MPSVLRRVNPAISGIALAISLMALVASAAGVGYAAGQIGSSDLANNAVTAKKIANNAVTTKKIKKNAVTTKKVKNGSLTASDMVAQEKDHLATLSNGGEGDCVWQPGGALVSGATGPTYRKDRFGTVHLGGLAIAADGAGGDGSCDPSDPGQDADAIAFFLPAGYIPAHTVLAIGGGSGVLVAGPGGTTFEGKSFAAGAVVGFSGGGVALDGVSFEPVGSSVVLPRQAGHPTGKADLSSLLGAH